MTADPFHNHLCDCESMGGRFGAHRVECPTAVSRRADHLPPILPSQPLWSYLRTAVQIGPFGPNATTVASSGGLVSLTPTESEQLEAAALAWVRDRLTHQWVQQCVTETAGSEEVAAAVLDVVSREIGGGR